MSIVCHLKQVSPTLLEKLIKNPSILATLVPREDAEIGKFNREIFPEKDIPELELDVTWQALHFLITGQEEGGELPLANTILGDKSLEVNFGYGPCCYLTSTEVKEVTKALLNTPRKALEKNFDISKMNELVYWTWDEQDLDYLLDTYSAVVRYYKEAMEEGNAMLLYLL